MKSSNTGSKLERKPGTFVKGDPRINRNGRPRSFDQVRELAKTIGAETITLSNGEKIDRIEAILRVWCGSKDLNQQRAFVEYAYGKVPDKTEVELFQKKVLELHYDHERTRNGNGSRLPATVSQGTN